jgi:hypothetical protein
MTGFLKIKNWEKFQHYKDRNPPWIKLHAEILTSMTWVSLDDASRVLAVASMVIASKNDGMVPTNPDYMMRVAYLNQKPDFLPLINIGFFEKPLADASNLQADARPETEHIGKKVDAEKKEKDLRPLAKAEISAPEMQMAVSSYNAMADRAGLPKVQKFTDTRKSKLRQRLKDCGGLAGWQEALKLVEESDFLRGSGNEGWKADIDFLLQEKSFTRLMEGFYNNRKGKNHEPKSKGNADEELRKFLDTLADEEPGCGSGDGIQDPKHLQGTS